MDEVVVPKVRIAVVGDGSFLLLFVCLLGSNNKDLACPFALCLAGSGKSSLCAAFGRDAFPEQVRLLN